MIDLDHLRLWVGKEQTVDDTIDLAVCQRMEATLDQPAQLEEGEPLPTLWHWLYFHQPARQSLLGRDGHPEKGGFLPPVPLPRRMWAGGRFEFQAPLPIGGKAQRQSTIKSVDHKKGRSGELCFVTVKHQVTSGGTICLIEEHDIVYRHDPKPDDKPVLPLPADGDADFSRAVTPSPVMLFRYSALTFNGHRIHYDRDYCRDVEGYPGLVFHGPLTATLLADLAVRNNPGRRFEHFEFRALAPIFDTTPFSVSGWQRQDHTALQAVLPGDALAMKATARFG